MTPETLKANFGNLPAESTYPKQAVTLGIQTILSAKQIILLATGTGKQAIVRRAFDPNQPPSLSLPASWLKNHPHVTVITDFAV